MTVLIGHSIDGKTIHWLADACSDCNTTIQKDKAWDFRSVDAAMRGIKLFLTAKHAWFIEVDGNVAVMPEAIVRSVLADRIADTRQKSTDGWVFKDLGVITVMSEGDGLYAKGVKQPVMLALYMEIDPTSIERKADGSVEYAYGFFGAKFHRSHWDVAEINDMYTDDGIQNAVNAHLASLGYKSVVGWSEAGRQENEEADFDFNYGLVDEVFPELKGA